MKLAHAGSCAVLGRRARVVGRTRSWRGGWRAWGAGSLAAAGPQVQVVALACALDEVCGR